MDPKTIGFEKLSSPLFKGQWVEVPGEAVRYSLGKCYSTEHPTLGTIYLRIDRGTNYTNFKGSRIRDVARTSNYWYAEISTKPWDFGGTRVFTVRCSGEGLKVYEKEHKVRERTLRQFGVDPWDYLGPLPTK